MNIRDIDLNLLVLFDALMLERNVSRAAERVGMSQPAMSNGLARLRTQLADPLFIRTSKGMEPTERALELLEPIHKALNGLSEALSSKQSFIPEFSKRIFTIASSDYVEQLILPRVLEQLGKHAPGVTINCVRHYDSTLSLLESGQVDAIIHTLDNPQAEGFYVRSLFKDGLKCVVRKNHPCTIDLKAGKISMSSYLEYGHIMITDKGIGKGYMDSQLDKKNKPRRVAVNVRQTSSSAVMIALETNLIATVPAFYAQKMVKLLPLVIFEPPMKIPGFELSMLWSPVSHHNQAHLWFRRLVFDVCDNIKEIA